MSYLVFSERGKLHLCESRAIAQLVASNLQARGAGKTSISEAKGDNLGVDFGGCMITGTLPHSVPGTPVKFLSHHYSLLRKEVNSAQRKPREGYYKLHGWLHAVCLSQETFERLQAYLVDQEATLLELEAISTEAITERMAQIR